jgi:hypothetical protein
LRNRENEVFKLAAFATISEAKMNDKKFLQHLNPSKGSILVFDKAYNYCRQFAEWTPNKPLRLDVDSN